MMMPLQLPPGLERNNTAYDTVDRWYDTNLVRWQSGTLKPIPGWSRITGSALTGTIRAIHVYRDNDDARKYLIGTDRKLYNTTYTDITPSAFTVLDAGGPYAGYGDDDYGEEEYGTARSGLLATAPYTYWSFSNWGEDVIVSSKPDGRVFYYDTSTPNTAPAVITDAPTATHGSIVTAEQHVMVFGGTVSATHYPRRVFWSSREDHTDWDFPDTTNTAGFQDLDTETPVLHGVKVKEGVLIFSYSDVFLAQYVGQPFVYGFQPLGRNSGMHPDSVATFNGRAVWLARDGFKLYEGGLIRPLDCPILADILGTMDFAWGPFRIHACHNAVHPEVWFFFPTTDETECDRYVIWNYAEGWWSWGDLARSAMCSAEVNSVPLMGDSSGYVYEHETGWTNSGASLVGQRWAYSGALTLGNGDRSMKVRRLLAASSNQNLGITFTTQRTPDGAERTFGPYTPRSNGYTDTRVQGRGVRLKLAATADDDWGFGKAFMDVAEGPRR